MEKVTLVERNACTACGECAFVCPTNSIHFLKDKTDNIYPEINYSTCISCGKCKKHCHVEHECVINDEAKKVYVAWNNDVETREKAASGGIVSAIYRYCLDNGYKTFGVTYIFGEGAIFKEILSYDDILSIRNSKYCYSRISDMYPVILRYLKEGYKVVIPALPCQIASILMLCEKYREQLILIDLVCHGVSAQEYLNQHIIKIESRVGKYADKIFFRDPKEGTNNFIFSLYSKEKQIYKSAVAANDVYQLGYHRALIYRDNCYECRYAYRKRLGDLTVSDFTGLGRIENYSESKDSVSCVLVSTSIGDNLIKELVLSGYITVQKRPVDEAYKFEKQLNHPSIPHKHRDVFLKAYMETGNFEKSARKALRKELLLYWSGLRRLKRFVNGVITHF